MATPLNTAELEIPHALEAAPVNILIVDDLNEKLLVFQSILEDLGQNLVLAHSGRDALRQLLEHEFAVILLDVNMPDIDGFETAAMIRQYKKTAQTPIIFITAYADDMQTTRGYSLGAVDYITTPVVPEILRSKVKVFVDLYRMNQQVLQWAQEREALVRAEAARTAAEEATRRADFLAEASHILTRSLDGDSIIRALLNLVVPTVADIAVLTLTDSFGNVRRTEARAHHSGMIVDSLHGVVVQVDSPPHLQVLIQESLHSGEGFSFATPSLWKISESSGSTLDNADEDSSCVAIQQVTALPLRTGTQLLGMLLLAYSPLRHQSAAEDALVNELAGRASIALENGLLYSTIEEADRRKNEFLAMLAHELRNPLAPIRNAIHIVQLLKLDNLKLDWAADIIGRQVNHITHIVDELLDVSRIALGKVMIDQKIITLEAVLAHSLETSRPHIDEKNHALHFKAPARPIYLKGDVVRLTQVFANLLHNAAKYTAPNGEIWFEADCENSVVTVSVRDSGEGVAPEFLPHMFDLFSQADQAIDRAEGGLGVGLALVKQLVELHGGSVEVRSAGRNCGTEFTVRLPQHQLAKYVASEPEYKTLPVATEQIRVLIVDDLKAAADSMRILLEMKNYSVEIAYDGVAALEVAQSFRPDVILLDIGLPNMDGYEVARRLRATSQAGVPLLIALTGYGQPADRQKAMDAGFDHHLIKPADVHVVCNLIAEHYGASPSGQSAE
jgi:signal transduction histidine kinase/DNA-binding response OmpR family regulator